MFRRVSSKLRLNKKEVAIVTGAGAGIGTQIAKELCARGNNSSSLQFERTTILDSNYLGAKVIWSARDSLKANRVLNDIVWSDDHGPTGYVLQIDLASKKSIENFVKEYRKRKLLHYLHRDIF